MFVLSFILFFYCFCMFWLHFHEICQCYRIVILIPMKKVFFLLLCTYSTTQQVFWVWRTISKNFVRWWQNSFEGILCLPEEKEIFPHQINMMGKATHIRQGWISLVGSKWYHFYFHLESKNKPVIYNKVLTAWAKHKNIINQCFFGLVKNGMWDFFNISWFLGVIYPSGELKWIELKWDKVSQQ